LSAASHLIIAPVLIPAVVAPFALLVMRRRRRVGVALSLFGCVAMLAAAIALMAQAQDDAIRVYAIGGWQPPFGIVLVLARLAAIMLVLAATLATLVMTHAVVTGLDRKGWHFHPMFQFQLLGLNGAFLTGDLFNLFVFFEVLLIASYGLMLHGQGTARLKAGVHYVVINIVGSTLFLIAMGLLYGLTGTLNMADMSLRVAALPAGDQGLLRAAALLLVAVFALKAAILPLHLWLPRTYAAAAPAVAALFAIMTKVGVYAIIRVVPLVFGADAGAAAWAPAPWLLPAALLTALVGFAGVLAGRTVREQAAYAVLASTGTLLSAVATWREDALAAALYYLPHSTLAGAALFLVADAIGRRRAGYADSAAPGPGFADRQAVAALFMLAAIGIVGLPPLSGFVGKLLILQSTFGADEAPWIWGTVLGTTLIGILGFARTGSAIFWKTEAANAASRSCTPGQADLIAPAAAIGLLGALTLGAGPVTEQAAAAAAQIIAPDRYIGAVLPRGAS